MPANERGSLRAAFSNFRQDADKEAELKLLGRTVDPPPPEASAAKQPPANPEPPQSYPVATGTGAQPAATPVVPCFNAKPSGNSPFAAPSNSPRNSAKRPPSINSNSSRLLWKASNASWPNCPILPKVGKTK
jgi:hypothetical protein